MTFGLGVLFSIGVGLFIGAAYALIGSVLVLIQGSQVLQAHGLTMRELLLLYLGGGLIGGTIVGLLHRVARRSRFFAALVGYLAMYPFMVSIGMLSESSEFSPFEIAATTSLLGAAVAASLWKDIVTLMDKIGSEGRTRRDR